MSRETLTSTLLQGPHLLYAQTQTTTYLPDPSVRQSRAWLLQPGRHRHRAQLRHTLEHPPPQLCPYRRLQERGGHRVRQPSDDQPPPRPGGVRQHGKKIVLRFAYDFGDYDPNHPFQCTNADASEATILKHIGQVVSSLEPYKDVILAFEAGFIGCWGEWHSSWYQANDEMSPKIRIVQGMADTFGWINFLEGSYPYEPPIAVRYPQPGSQPPRKLADRDRQGSGGQSPGLLSRQRARRLGYLGP